MRGSRLTLHLLRCSARPVGQGSLCTVASYSWSAACLSAAFVTPVTGYACRRWASSSAPGADHSEEEEPVSASEAEEGTKTNILHVMERAADARREIFDIWSRVIATEEDQRNTFGSSEEEAAAATARATEERCNAVSALMERHNLNPSTPREEDISRGLGDALDRLLLLCVPLSPAHGADLLVQLFQVSARQGRQISMQTIQHLFARSGSYGEALAIFYAMRRSNFAMSMEAYHAMLYSLQRLEEEGWAARFHEEFATAKGEKISEQALDFVLRGVDNQLLPENKPWLGRIMFAEVKDNASSRRRSAGSLDEMGRRWVQRYKNGGASTE